MMPEITLLQKSQVDQSVRVLTDIFADDVMWQGILPDAAERNRVMPMLWRGVVAYCLRYGIVSTTPDMSRALQHGPGPGMPIQRCGNRFEPVSCSLARSC